MDEGTEDEGQLYETSFDTEGNYATRKLPPQEISEELQRILDKQKDEGITFRIDWRARREGRPRDERVQTIIVRHPRVPNPLAEHIVRDVGEKPIKLEIHLEGKGGLYEIRCLKKLPDDDA